VRACLRILAKRRIHAESSVEPSVGISRTSAGALLCPPRGTETIAPDKRTASQFRHDVSTGSFSLRGGGDDVLRDDALRMAGRRKRAAGCHVERRGWRVMSE
jgi:hypothetical protein